jgi:hypothetical protein
MQDETKNRLDSFFEAQENEKRRRVEAEAARLKEQEENLNAFLACATNVIEPALDEMAKYLQERGMHAEIRINRPKDGEKTVANSHAIEICFPKNMQVGVTEPPHFKFTYNIAEGVVSLWRRTNHSNLPAMRLKSEQITRAFVEDEFAKYFTAGI